MRVRVNFTVDFDLDEFRQHMGMGTEDKAKARAMIQEAASTMTLDLLRERGIKATSLGRNNAYDPETRQTIHEEYVNS